MVVVMNRKWRGLVLYSYFHGLKVLFVVVMDSVCICIGYYGYSSLGRGDGSGGFERWDVCLKRRLWIYCEGSW